MIRADQIPDEVVEAAAKLLAATNGWKHDNAVSICKPVAVELLAAALSAWPGVQESGLTYGNISTHILILPLPTEMNNK